MCIVLYVFITTDFVIVLFKNLFTMSQNVKCMFIFIFILWGKRNNTKQTPKKIENKSWSSRIYLC